MPARITIECTHCGAKLNLSDDSKLGRKMRCPKCSEVFVAASADEDTDDLFEDEDEEELQPKKKSAAAAGGKKGAAAKGGKKGKGKAAKSGGNLGLIIGGAVGVVALLVGLVGVLFATGAFGGKKVDPNQIVVTPGPGTGVFSGLLKEEAPPPAAAASSPAGQFLAPTPLDQKWLPPGTEVIVRVKVADLWQAPLLKNLTTGPQADEMLATMKQQTGLEPAQIEAITIALPDLQKSLLKAKASATPNEPPRPDIAALGIVELKTTLDPAAFTQAVSGKSQTHQGKSYIEFPAVPNVPETIAGYFADAKTLLIGDQPTILKAIERGESKTPRSELAFLDAGQHLLIAALTTTVDPELMSQLEQSGAQSPAMVAQMKQFTEKVHGGSIGFKVTGGIQALVSVSCKSPAAAQELKALIDMGTALAASQFQAERATMPPFVADLVELLVTSLKSGEQNQIIQVHAGIPDSAQDKLAQLPAMLMLMAMTSGMGQGAGGSPLDLLFGGGPGGPADVAMPGGESSPGDMPAFDRPDTEPTNVAAKSAKGLPKGFELKGSLSDGYHRVEAGERALGFSLELNFQGEADQCRVAAIGKLQRGVGTLFGGETFALIVPEGFHPEQEEKPLELLVNFNSYGGIGASPGNYELTIPEERTEPIQSITGTFSYITGKKSKLIQIKDARAQAGKEPTDPALKAAGLTIELGKMNDGFGDAETLTVTVKKGYLLTRLEAIDAQGKLSYEAFPGLSPNEQVQILKPGVGSLELKPGTGFQAFLYSDLKEVEIPFTFEKIELPKQAADAAKEN